MKNIVFIIAAIIFLTGSISAQQSDYLTIQEFKEEIELFKHKIDNAITSQQLENIELDISEFQQFYAENEEIINRATYPSTMDSKISALRATLITNENRLLLIEHQREQLFEMSNRITAQRNEINRLYSITDSMKTEILMSQASEARLSEMISDYRERLELRDQLVFKMIDSLIITHENIIFSRITEGQAKSFSIPGSQNPLNWIQAVIDENLNYTKHQNRLLQVEDYIRMHSMQQHFENVWKEVGDDFVRVYGGDQKNRIAQSIETSIYDWKNVTTQKMWTAIDQYLDIHEIELSSFDNRQSFHAALDAFIKNGRELSEDEFLTTNGLNEYQKIAEFWNSTFKNDWNLMAVDNRLLSSGEISMIDVALSEWEGVSRPIHPMLVAIISIMIVSLTGFILVMIRSKAVR